MFSLFMNTTKKPVLNHRAEIYLGRICVVIEEIECGRGKVRANDKTVWRVIGEDCPVNKKVEVMEVVDAMVFRVRQFY